MEQPAKLCFVDDYNYSLYIYCIVGIYIIYIIWIQHIYLHIITTKCKH